MVLKKILSWRQFFLCQKHVWFHKGHITNSLRSLQNGNRYRILMFVDISETCLDEEDIKDFSLL